MRFRRLNPYAWPRDIIERLCRRRHRDVRTRPPAKATSTTETQRHRGSEVLNSFLKSLCVLSVLCGFHSAALALDRDSFTFTDYNLTIKIDPGFHVLRSFGTVVLRNDSDKPQHIAVLQISSSLRWESIRLLPAVSSEATPPAPTEKEKSNGKLVQYVVQPYTSDIDHTGELSEAIVTLSADVTPRTSVQLEIAYSGIIEPSSGRWDRVAVP